MKILSLLIIALLLQVTLLAQSAPKWKIEDVQKYIDAQPGDVVVINFWATFCKPCVAEIPSFISTVKNYRDSGVSLLLVSLDLPGAYPEKLNAFVKEKGYDTKVAWLNENNADYFCPKIDKKWSGSIPSTLFINKKTGYHKFHEEELAPAKFQSELELALHSVAAPAQGTN